MIVKIIAAIFIVIAFVVFGAAIAVAFMTAPPAEVDPLDPG